MEFVPRNVILDLLPAYMAGEASEETRSLVEKFAENDPQISRLIAASKLEKDPVFTKIAVPEDLEMKTFKKFRRSIRLQMVYAALAVIAVLIVPLVAMQFTTEVNWNFFDFLIMGILLLGTGITYILISKISENNVYRFAVGVAVVSGLLLIWINLAVGIIGSENNPANILYLGVFATCITGAAISRFSPAGMAYTMFAAAIVQILVPLIAFIFWRSSIKENISLGILGLNAFFAILFIISAIMFRSVTKKQK